MWESERPTVGDTSSGFGGLPLSDVGLCDGSLHTSHNVGLRDELGTKEPLDRTCS